MTVVAVLHFVFGALGIVWSVGVIGFGIALFVPAAAHVFDSSPVPFLAHARAYAPGFIADGVARFAMNVVLIVAGIRVLDVVPAGRRLSLTAVMAWTILSVVELYGFDGSIFVFFFSMAYPVAIELLFLQPKWRAAFSGERVLAART